MIDKSAREGDELYQERRRTGAKLLTGRSKISNKGYFTEPTVFADVSDDMKIFQEEIFGPVMSIIKFKDLDEAVVRANNTTYGLGRCCYS